MASLAAFAAKPKASLQRWRRDANRIARGFERNFSTPLTAEERRIKELDDEYRAKKVAELEQEMFQQRKRLADAERKLKVKETKTALN